MEPDFDQGFLMPFLQLVVCAVVLGLGHACIVAWGSRNTWDWKKNSDLVWTAYVGDDLISPVALCTECYCSSHFAGKETEVRKTLEVVTSLPPLNWRTGNKALTPHKSYLQNISARSQLEACWNPVWCHQILPELCEEGIIVSVWSVRKLRGFHWPKVRQGCQERGTN